MYATRKSEWIRLIHGDAPILKSQIALHIARRRLASNAEMLVRHASLIAEILPQSFLQVNPASIQRRAMLSFHSLLVARH